MRVIDPKKKSYLTAVNVCGHGNVQGLLECEGKFDTNHKFEDGFKPDDGWYFIGCCFISNIVEMSKICPSHLMNA